MYIKSTAAGPGDYPKRRGALSAFNTRAGMKWTSDFRRRTSGKLNTLLVFFPLTTDDRRPN